VPRKYANLAAGGESFPYVITGGQDKKIRYWDLQNLGKKSYYVNSPDDDECVYHAEYMGDVLVVQEKINAFKSFP